MPFETGYILNNRYRIERLLGQGGFGAVYKAYDLSLDRICAVKENMDTSPEAHRQFQREASVLANLSHPNLPRVTDHFSIEGSGQYLVMDFIEGQDLQSMTDQLGALPIPKVVAWIGQVIDALNYMHSRPQPVLHRDIKPANIRITPEGNAILVDFGLVKLYDPHLKTTVGARAITPGYSPPEQYGQGSTDVRSDIYALGATMFALLTGQHPPESVQRVAADTLKPAHVVNPQVPVPLSQTVARAMAMIPDQRFQSMADFKTALTGQGPVSTPKQFVQPSTIPMAASPAVAGTVESIPPESMVLPKPKKKSSIGWIIGGVAGGLALIAGVICIILYAVGAASLGSATDTPKAPTAPPSIPTIAPTENLILYNDDFSNSSTGWGDGDLDNGSVHYNSGYYSIFVKTAGYFIWSNPGKTFNNQVTSVSATYLGPAKDASFGLICNYTDRDNYYYTGIGIDGFYAIVKTQNGTDTVLTAEDNNWTLSDYIPLNATSYDLAFECANNELVLSVNGVEIDRVTDYTFSSGDIGMFVYTFNDAIAEVHFDNLTVESVR